MTVIVERQDGEMNLVEWGVSLPQIGLTRVVQPQPTLGASEPFPAPVAASEAE